MGSNLEVKVITARSFAHVALNGSIKTVEDAVREAGQNPEDCTIRVDGVLVTDMAQELKGGETISAFATRTIASAGVKGQGPEDEEDEDEGDVEAPHSKSN